MAQIVLLCDVTQAGDEFGVSRAIAPYVLSSKARAAGYTTVVIDLFTKIEDLQGILSAVIGPETLFIGISGTFLSVKNIAPTNITFKREYYSGYLWCDTFDELNVFLLRIRLLIAAKCPNAKFVLGGAKALIAIQTKEMQSLFDYYVIGKGESFFTEMMGQIASSEPLPLQTYENAKFLHESNYGKVTESIEAIQWNSADAVLPHESLPLEIAKGCLYNCKFCHFDKQGSIRQSSDRLREQLIRNYELFGTTVYYFCDDCFNDTRLKVESICSTLLSLPFKIEWVSYARVDVAVKFPQTLDLMVESGARGLFWGLETFDHKVGKSIGKGTDPELVKAMLINLKQKYGDRVLCTGSFIIGLPGETEESLRATNRWIIESKVLDDVSYFPLSLRPYSERLDKAVIDYADYSRDPKKYGFTSISFNPVHWAHQNMDRPRAFELKHELVNELKQNGLQNSFAQNIFQYPYFRTLGLSHDEVVKLYRQHVWGDGRFHEIKQLEIRWHNNYEKQLRHSLGLSSTGIENHTNIL